MAVHSVNMGVIRMSASMWYTETHHQYKLLACGLVLYLLLLITVDIILEAVAVSWAQEILRRCSHDDFTASEISHCYFLCSVPSKV